MVNQTQEEMWFTIYRWIVWAPHRHGLPKVQARQSWRIIPGRTLSSCRNYGDRFLSPNSFGLWDPPNGRTLWLKNMGGDIQSTYYLRCPPSRPAIWPKHFWCCNFWSAQLATSSSMSRSSPSGRSWGLSTYRPPENILCWEMRSEFWGGNSLQNPTKSTNFFLGKWCEYTFLPRKYPSFWLNNHSCQNML